MSSHPQCLSHPMQSQPGQIGYRSDAHDFLECVFQGALTHPCGDAKVRHIKTISGVRYGVVFGQPDDAAVSLPRTVSESELVNRENLFY